MRKIYQQVDDVWTVVKYGCMYCDRTYNTLYNIEKHIVKCRINTTKRIEKQKLKDLKEMPVQAIMKNGERYYRWGDSGKLYKNRSDAEAQGRAAYASGYRGSDNSNDSKKKVGSDGKVCWEGYRYGGTNPDGSDKCIKVKR